MAMTSLMRCATEATASLPSMVTIRLPDMRAAERTFQVLTQVAGRAGRSPLGGQVILQTFQPEHYVIQAAAHHDYGAFFRQEID
jgi:primosomal protein N' (replication factor Y)